MSCNVMYCRVCNGTYEVDRINRATGLCNLCDEADPVPGLTVRVERAESHIADLERQLAEEKRITNRFRFLLASSSANCPYCDLPADEMAKCPAGFPGCGRADDLMYDIDEDPQKEKKNETSV